MGKKIKVGKKNKVDVDLIKVGDGVGISGKDLKRALEQMSQEEAREFVQQVKDPKKREALEYAIGMCQLAFAYEHDRSTDTLALIGVKRAYAKGDGKCIITIKQGDYRGALKKEFEENEWERIVAKEKDNYNKMFPDDFDVNHRFAVNRFNTPVREKALADALRSLGVDDVNNPKVTEFMLRGQNRGRHSQLWKLYLDEAEREGPLSGEKVLSILRKIESSSEIDYSRVYRSPDAIKI